MQQKRLLIKNPKSNFVILKFKENPVKSGSDCIIAKLSNQSLSIVARKFHNFNGYFSSVKTSMRSFVSRCKLQLITAHNSIFQ